MPEYSIVIKKDNNYEVLEDIHHVQGVETAIKDGKTYRYKKMVACNGIIFAVYTETNHEEPLEAFINKTLEEDRNSWHILAKSHITGYGILAKK